LNNIDNQHKTLFDIRPFLHSFCALDAVQYKNNFTHSGEHLYLFPVHGDVFMFVMTRSSDIIRKVNTREITVEQIRDLLGEDNQLGFASYVLITENCFGFGSTLLAPKSDVFIEFINTIFISLGIVNWKLIPFALTHQATRAEAMEMSIIGTTVIEISKENTFAEDFLRQLGMTTEETHNLEGFELTFKPRSRQNIKPVITNVLQQVPDDGITKLIIKAKNEVSGHMTDLYLVNSGILQDDVNNSSDLAIARNMVTKKTNNTLLTEKLEEFTQNEDLSESTIDAISRYNHITAWTDFVSTVQTVSE
ncbi:hypothetical protein QWY97_10570, partial [Vibrio cortegadensis]